LIILSINTSTKQFSLAVMHDEIVVGEYLLSTGSSHFRELMPALDDLLSRTTLTAQQLEGIAVALGPGSFTGIRAGMSVAKGLCQGLDIPIVGIPTLSALASQMPYVREDICPLVTSRRGELFAALFRWDMTHRLTRVTEDTCIETTNLGSLIHGRTIFIGNDFPAQGPLITQQIGEKGLLAPATLWGLRASSVGALGLKRFKRGDSDSLSELAPIYLRGADIRVPTSSDKVIAR
jgi:tRNA threonylcarbamoyladenosine biosynthesis protein TsaB